MMPSELSSYQFCPGRRPDSCSFGNSPIIAIDSEHLLAPNTEVWKCDTCGHGVSRPAMPDVAPLYEGRESEDFLSRDPTWVTWLKERAFTALAQDLLRFSASPPRLVIDFGTGNGMLAACLASRVDPACETIALDYFTDPPSAIGSAKYQSFALAEPLVGRADFLTCFHVVEHDDDPHKMIANLTRFLRPGGTIVIEVPNVDCVWTPWFGRACANWYVPYHRVHFSRESLRNLILAHDLEIILEKDICGPTFALSFAKFLDVKPNAFLFAVSAALRPLQWLAEKVSKKPSALRIIARAKGCVQ